MNGPCEVQLIGDGREPHAFVANWPFGDVYVSYLPGLRCSCGNPEFAVATRKVETAPATEESEAQYRDDVRIVCPRCIRWIKDEWIIGMVDFATMVAVIFAVPRPAPDPRAFGGDAPADAMDRIIPYGVEFFDWAWWEDAWVPPLNWGRAPAPEYVGVERPTMVRGGRRKKGALPPGASLPGVEEDATPAPRKKGRYYAAADTDRELFKPSKRKG